MTVLWRFFVVCSVVLVAGYSATYAQDGIDLSSTAHVPTAWDNWSDAATTSGNLRQRSILIYREPGPLTALAKPIPPGTPGQLARMARQSRDPIVLLALSHDCGMPQSGCDALDFANRFAALEPTNAAAWLNLAALQRQAGQDEAAAQSQLRVAEATEWNDYYFPMIQALLPIIPKSASTADHLEAVEGAIARVVLLPQTPIEAVAPFCQRENNAQACANLLSLLMKDPKTLRQVAVSAGVSRRAGLADSLVESRREAAEAYRWALAQGQLTASRGTLISETAPGMLVFFRQMIDEGEVGMARRILAGMRLSERQAALRFRAAVAHSRPRS